jgi:hypothetical protein
MPLESQLEDMIDADPSLIGTDLLLIGRQVPTAYGKYIDLLGIDSEGSLHVLELKRDKTPRDVVAQALDYGSWIQTLGNEDVRDLFHNYRPTEAFDAAFAERFNDAPPDLLNENHVLTIIASSLDPSTERIVSYLNTIHRVPINVVFFKHFSDHGNAYLARTWLVDKPTQAAAAAAVGHRGRAAAPWNGRDWYISFGDDPSGISRSWEDARKYGFISAGGGKWYSRTLASLPEGARVFVCVPQRGYVGVGIVTGIAQPADDARLRHHGTDTPFRELPLVGQYRHPGVDNATNEGSEHVVPVEWISTRPIDQAVWRTGMFANQNSACRLRSQFTIEEVSRAFGIED